MMNKSASIKDKKGFTLVEVIISIGFLCIACGIIIQLFIASGDVRSDTVVKETAAVMASNAVEACRVSKSPESIGEGFFNESATVYSEEDGSYVIRQYFSNEWLPANGGKDPFYVIKTVVKPAQMLPNQNDIIAGLYDITVTTELVSKYRDGSGILAEYETSKYYVFRKGGGAE